MKINRHFIGIIALVSVLAACNQLKEKIGNPFYQGKTDKDNTTDTASANTTYSMLTTRNTSDEIRGKRYALVIGNANYVGDSNIGALKNPVNDARDMKKTLETVGFKVTYRENAVDKEAMETAVDEFTQQLERNKGIALFYYAGHGIQADGVNYLIPTKASIPTQVQLKHRAMSASYVLDNMEYTKNALNIIVLDACRNNPLPARGRSVAKSGLAEMKTPSSSVLIYSTAPGKQAYDGDGRNGIFTKYLLKGIKENGHKPIGEMLMHVRMDVQQATRNKPVSQVPWENTSIFRKFCFSPSGCRDPEAEAIRIRAAQAERDRKQAVTAKQQAQEEARRQAEKIKRLERQLEKQRRLADESAKPVQEEKPVITTTPSYSTGPRTDDEILREAARIRALRQAEIAKQQAEEKARKLAQEIEMAKRQLEEEKNKRAEEERIRAENAQRDKRRPQQPAFITTPMIAN